MQQLVSLWIGLDGRRRVLILVSTALMFTAVLVMSRMAASPSLSLLYSGLEPETAGEVVLALEQRAVSFEVRGSSIFVSARDRDELRMTLASEGLPTASGQGYELLDSLTGFGTTAQMFDAAYWRAKEGELARTIVSSPMIRSARVHISNSTSQPFRRATSSSASVSVTAASGKLSTSHAKALRYLVASAVAGLTPENVSVIDGQTGTVLTDDDQQSTGTGNDRAAGMKRNVERLLEARVGQGNAVVEVYVETSSEREAITERRFDPDSRVAISTETEEHSTNSNDTRGGAVTVASNLPEGDGAGGDNKSSSQNTETRERVNFEVSETTREILRTPGIIKRVSTAVLLDGVLETDATTGATTWVPRSDEEMATLEELVASAVGFDPDRGDTLTLKSLQFEPVQVAGSVAAASLFQKLNLDVMQLIQAIVLAVVSIVLGLFVIRPIVVRSTPSALPGPAFSAASAAAIPTSQISGSTVVNSGGQAPVQALTGEIDHSKFSLPTQLSAPNRAPPANGGLQLGTTSNAPAEVPVNPVDRLRQMIEDRQDESVELLKSWIEDGEEHV
ncbi:MAG: flagellar M-ring protein FliF [Marinosulfonomonas sp.]|nr:flagellar M-ring protein FliF [Marinosulfonomonas sp.]